MNQKFGVGLTNRSFKNIIILIIIIAASSFSIDFVNFENNNNHRDPNLVSSAGLPVVPFIVGVTNLPVDLDPQDTWDSSSGNVIDQVCEGLFAYNLSDPQHAIIPLLATTNGAWSADSLNYTVSLRTNVTFHDGTPFNALAVQWNWDRMAWALNSTGTNLVGVTRIEELYVWLDGTPIVDYTEVVSEFEIKFVLNAPYAPFQALLCSSGSFIQSPLSTPQNAYLVTASSDLVGTGPFIYDSHEAGVEVKLHAFDNYWKGNASIDELVFKRIADSNARNLALLAGDIHFLSDPHESYYGIFNMTAGLTFEEGPQSAILQYLGMNNNLINVSFRKAISYALDYDYIINNFKGGYAVRAKSPIPLGISYSNSTFDVPILNLTHARLIMQSMGFGAGFNVNSDVEWVIQESISPFAIFNYSYYFGNLIQEDILVLLQDNLSKIGIRVTGAGMMFGEFISRLIETGSLHRDMVELYWLGRGLDYNDPSDIINNMFTNRSIASNGVQYDGFLAAIEDGRDPYALYDNVQLLMEEAISETNPAIREIIYTRIQELLIERDYPMAWGYVDKLYYAYNVNLTGFQPNTFKKLDFYSCQWDFIDYYSIVLSHPLDINYYVGSTGNAITWNITANYTLNPIYNIYKNNLLNATNSWISGIPVNFSVDGLPIGIYEYRIEVHNAYETAEDIVIVSVFSVESGIPGYSLTFIIILSLLTLFYLRKRIRGKIGLS